MAGGIPEKYRDLFNKRAFASLGTLMPDGRPQVTPVWIDLEGDHVIFVGEVERCGIREDAAQVAPLVFQNGLFHGLKPL